MTAADVGGDPGDEVRVHVGADDLEIGQSRLVRADGERLLLVRTAQGYRAMANACPHQGYGLAGGSFDGEFVTCRWHNWRFRADDGTCVVGEEDIAVHPTDVVDHGPDAGVHVTVRRPAPAEVRDRTLRSLDRGIERAAFGQIARDTVRLLAADAEPADLVAHVLASHLRATEWGPDHELAVLSDVLALASVRTGADRARALVPGLVGLSETTHHRPHRPASSAAPAEGSGDGDRFGRALEAEDVDGAIAELRARRAADPDGWWRSARTWCIDWVSGHHLSYGHGAIFLQKAFELVERAPAAAEVVVEELVVTLVDATREDTLPYLRRAAAAVHDAPVDAMAAAPRRPVPDEVHVALVDRVRAATDAPIDALVDHALAYGVLAVVDALSAAAAAELLDVDEAEDRSPDVPFGWLDVTHVLTLAEACRWMWTVHPGPGAARAVLWAGWLAFDAGRRRRHEDRSPSDRWRAHRHPRADGERGAEAVAELAAAVTAHRGDDAVRLAATLDVHALGEALVAIALSDRAGSWIVSAHDIKSAVAARREAAATGSSLPLVAVARYLAGARAERFVARQVEEAIDLVERGRPTPR